MVCSCKALNCFLKPRKQTSRFLHLLFNTRTDKKYETEPNQTANQTTVKSLVPYTH